MVLAMKTIIAVSAAAKPLTKQQIKDCKDAKKVIDDLVKQSAKMSAEDIASVLTHVYDLVDVAKKVTWS